MAKMTTFAPFAAVVLWCSYLWSTASCQDVEPFDPLPEEVFIASSSGEFTWPAGDTGVFDEASMMTITWTSNFSAVNIYSIFNQTVGEVIRSQTQIATGYTKSSLDWTIDCAGDCSKPFVLRAVKAQGTGDELLNGGFWSRQFWIRPTASPSSVTTSSSTSQTSSSSTRSTESTSSASPASTPATSAADATSAAPVPPAASANSAENNDDEDSGDNTTAIGVGVGVGVGVALLLVGGIFFWRRYHRRMKEKYSRPPPDSASYQAQHFEPTSWYQPPEKAELDLSARSEIGGSGVKSPVEAPSQWRIEPQELPARESHS